jgi:DNA modification methylase
MTDDPRRIEYTRLADVRRADVNPKQHDLGEIVTSIRKRGFVELPAVDERTGKLVAGHGRIEALAALKKDGAGLPKGLKQDADGEWLVPVLHGWASKDDADAKAYLVASNRLVEVGGWDDDALNQLLVSIASDGGPDALLGTGFDGDDVDRILNELAKPAEGLAEIDSLPDGDAVPTGAMYRLGDHTLLCADSTKDESVARVLLGGGIDLVWTDPPYGVSYESAAGKVNNDGKDQLAPLLAAAFAQCFRVLKPGGHIYAAHPAGGHAAIFIDAIRAAGFRIKQNLVWAKDSLVLGHSDYHFQHEPILYAMKPGEGRIGRGGKGWYGDDSQVSVFSFPKPKRSDDHPTMKPVELVEAMLLNSTARGHTVFDPFSGSGTTLMACERLGRKARVIELDPVYVGRTIARWEAFTGRKSELVRA